MCVGKEQNLEYLFYLKDLKACDPVVSGLLMSLCQCVPVGGCNALTLRNTNRIS
jgi:hypothetical protein